MTTETCPETEASCECKRPGGHSGPHLCPCAGAWSREDGEFQIVNLPGDWAALAGLRREGVLPPLS